MIVLYTTHCPRCRVLESKLKQANIKYSTCEDMNKIVKLGFKTVPILSIDDTLLPFKEACEWADSQKYK